MDHRQNKMTKVLQLLEENTGVSLYDFGLGNVFFLDMTSKHKWQGKNRWV